MKLIETPEFRLELKSKIAKRVNLLTKDGH
jgi:hypothetical protein